MITRDAKSALRNGAVLVGMALMVALTPPAWGQPSGGMESFLSRMDQNGNGMLEPSEISDRMRGFLERVAQSDRSINLSQPIPISRLSQAMDRARQERERSGDGDRDRDRDRGRGSSRGDTPDLTHPGLVPGFATPDLPLVPGFGEDASLLVNVTDADRREASERLGRYDSNKDGFLDKEELARGRWSDQPFSYDRNRDGRLSRDELALRYADRRMAEEKERAQRQQSSSSSSSSRSGSSSSASRPSTPSTSGSSASSRSGGGVDPRMEGIVTSMMGRYDKNRNGVLDRDEWGDMRSDPSGGDKNRDGKITKEELAAWFSERFQSGGFGRGGDSSRGGSDRERGSFGGGPPGGGFGGGSFGGRPGGFGGDSGGPPNFYGGRGERSSRDDNDDDRNRDRGRGDSRSSSRGGDNGGGSTVTNAYRFQSTLERISSQYGDDLPEWFTRSDVNADGQVVMSEYAADWSETRLKEFLTLDRNGDGVIVPQECLAAVQEGFKQGSVASTPSSRAPYTAQVTSTSPPANGASSANGATDVSTAPSPAATSAPAYTEAQGASTSSGPSDIDPRSLSFAKGLFTKYDTNKDGVLDLDEASKMTLVKPKDADGDGKITVEEIARSM